MFNINLSESIWLQSGKKTYWSEALDDVLVGCGGGKKGDEVFVPLQVNVISKR